MGLKEIFFLIIFFKGYFLIREYTGRRVREISAGAATGLWSARVTNGDQQSGVKAASFNVTP